MTRVELARTVHASHGGLTLLAARELVNAMFEAVQEGLSRDGHVVISGFGTFRVDDASEIRGVQFINFLGKKVLEMPVESGKVMEKCILPHGYYLMNFFKKEGIGSRAYKVPVR